MSRVKIIKEDKDRVLLTELLPYEVPMLFSNDGFYLCVKSNGFKEFKRRIKEVKKSSGYGIPFNFEIRKARFNEYRTLSIIHPLNQLDFVDFYQKYDSLIVHLCSKSPFSLRKVLRVAKFFYVPELVVNNEDGEKDEDVELEPEILDEQTKFLKSYFTYYPVDLIYKFYERNDYQRLEQRFEYLLEFDIQKCFYNIYTHSITWAVKNKEYAKRNARAVSFENDFDAIMQKANYNETNGIVVGPEVSRIFAEIILQQIDLNVLQKLAKQKIKFGVDYEFRRYVDDCFVFSNDNEKLDLILETYRKELEYYKLYINPAKTIKRTRPFITNIAVAKIELKHLFNSFIANTFLVEENDTLDKKKIKEIKSPYYNAQNFIKDLQCIIQRNSVNYDVINKNVIQDLKRVLTTVLKSKDIEYDDKTLGNFLLMFFDIAFYSYSLNITANSTFKLAQMIVLCCKFLNDKSDELKHIVFSKIYREADFVMTIIARKSKPGAMNIEMLNLLIALRKLGEGYRLSSKKIKVLFELEGNYSELNYFQIITLLYYFGNDIQYVDLREKIEKVVIDRFITTNDPFTYAEMTFLFFDFISCPFISDKSKKRIVKESHYTSDKNDIEQTVENIKKQKVWFMDWDINIDLERVLKKKEWAPSY